MDLKKLFGIGEKITPIPQERKMILMYVRPLAVRAMREWRSNHHRC